MIYALIWLGASALSIPAIRIVYRGNGERLGLGTALFTAILFGWAYLCVYPAILSDRLDKWELP